MSWKTVRLELASTEGFPRGSASRAYLIRVPLDDDGAIDANAVRQNPALATVRRFWASEADEYGRIEPADTGWVLHCGGAGREVALMAPQPLRLNRHVTIESGDRRLPFRVASIRGLGPAAMPSS